MTAKASKHPSHLTSALKRQVKDLKIEVDQKVEEINVLRANIKSSKIKELEVEIKTYMDECLRLQRMLQESMRRQNPLSYLNISLFN